MLKYPSYHNDVNHPLPIKFSYFLCHNARNQVPSCLTSQEEQFVTLNTQLTLLIPTRQHKPLTPQLVHHFSGENKLSKGAKPERLYSTIYNNIKKALITFRILIRDTQGRWCKLNINCTLRKCNKYDTTGKIYYCSFKVTGFHLPYYILIMYSYFTFFNYLFSFL